MIKVFTTNKDGKIELTKDELKNLLDEAYWDGYKANDNSWTYITPSWRPYVWMSNGTATNVTLTSNTANPNVTVNTSDTNLGVDVNS